MPFPGKNPSPSARDPTLLSFQDNIVNFSLSFGKFPIYGKSSRDIGCIALVFGARIDEQKITVF